MTTTVPILPDRSGPDLSGVLDYASYSLDPGGETYTVVLGPESAAVRERAMQTAAARLAATPLLAAEEVSPEEAADLAALYDAWEPGTAYAVGSLVTHPADDAPNGTALYEVIQAHASQADWPPPAVPALFRRLYQPAPGQEYPVWVAPTGSHDAYQTGDRVLYPDADGQVYESTIDNNVWSPDAHPAGWTLIGE